MKNQQIEELLLKVEPSPALEELRDVLEVFEKDFEEKVEEIRRLEAAIKFANLRLEAANKATALDNR